VLTPVGLAVRLCADAAGFEASSRIGFDREDVVDIGYEPFEQDDPHATPIGAARLPVYADAATGRDVRYRDGAGQVTVYVTADDRVDAEADDPEPGDGESRDGDGGTRPVPAHVPPHDDE